MNSNLSKPVSPAERFRRRLHIDGHLMPDTPALGKFNASEFAREALRTGADSFSIHAKCHYGYSYYPTAFGHMHPGLNGRDLFGELSGELRRQSPGCGIFAYYTLLFSPVDSDLHPDWCVSEEVRNGETFSEKHIRGEWRVMCFNGPYRATVFHQFGELVEKYDIDGGFLDFSRSAGPCRCPACRKAYGKDIPLPGESGWEDYCRWKLRNNDEFVLELAKFLDAKKPGFLLESNYCYTLRHPLEVPPGIRTLTADSPERGVLTGAAESMEGRFLCTRRVPASIMTTSLAHWWSDWGRKSGDALKLQNAVISMLGCRPNLADVPYPDYGVHKKVFSLFREVFRQSKKIESVLRGSVQAPDLLVFFGEREYYAETRPANDSPAMLDSVRGVCNLLEQSRIHYLIVREDGLAERLSEVGTLLLADQEHLSEGTLVLVESFVKKGGRLLLLGRSLLNERLRKLAGIRSIRRNGAPFAFFERENDQPLIVRAPFYEAETEPGTRTDWKIREGFFSEFKFYTGAPVGPCRFPAVVRRGRVHAMMLSPHVSAAEWMYPELRRFFSEWCADGKTFCGKKSSNRVELVHLRRGGTDLVGLIGHPFPLTAGSCSGDFRFPYVIDGTEPVRELRLEFRLTKPPVSVDSVNGSVLVWSWKDGILSVEADGFHIWEILKIKNSVRS